MRAMVGSGLRLRSQPPPVGWQVAATVVLATAVLGWSALELADVLGKISLGTSGRFYAVTAAMPLGLGLAMMLAHGNLPRGFGLAFAWTAIFAIALISVPHVESSVTYAFAPAAVAAGTLLLRRWPAFGVLLLFALTAAAGSLIAFFRAPTGTVSYLVLGGLWIGAVIGYFSGERRIAVRPWPGAIVLAAFLLMSVLQMALSGNFGGEFTSFRTNGLYLSAVLLLAYAPWPAITFERIAKGILITAILAGAYAALRLAIGPAHSEFAFISGSPYSYVNGKLKLAGSFGSAAALGAWTASMMPFCAAMALAMRDRWRPVALLAFALCGVGMFGSQLRSALVGVTVGLLVVLIVYQPARAFRGLRLGTTIVAILCVLGAGAAGIVATGGGPKGHSYQSITQPSRDLSVSDRLFKWRDAIRDLRGKPFGYGIGTATSGYATQAKTAHGRFTLNVGAYSIDSGYLKIALEQGYYATGLFAAALLLMLGGLARRAITLFDRIPAGIALGGCGTLAAFMVLLLTDAFQEGLPALGIWIVVGLGAAEVSRAMPRSSRSPASVDGARERLAAQHPPPSSARA